MRTRSRGGLLELRRDRARRDLSKPFAFGELIARLHALARRGEIERLPVLEVDDLQLDPVTHRVWRGGQEIELSAKEFLLLATLMRHPGRAMSHQQLLDHAWDGEYEVHSNVVDVYIGYLRDKVDRPYEQHTIETVRGWATGPSHDREAESRSATGASRVPAAKALKRPRFEAVWNPGPVSCTCSSVPCSVAEGAASPSQSRSGLRYRSGCRAPAPAVPDRR